MNFCNSFLNGGEKLKEEWTGNLVGRMHNADVTFEELGAEVGWGKPYISMILNGSRNPADAKEKLEAAFERIVQKRQSN